MFQRMAAQVGALLAFDAGALAQQSGSPLAVNMVLLGALAATESLPITAQDILSVIHTCTKEKFLASNLKAFELGAAWPGTPATGNGVNLRGGRERKIFVKVRPHMIGWH